VSATFGLNGVAPGTYLLRTIIPTTVGCGRECGAKAGKGQARVSSVVRQVYNVAMEGGLCFTQRQ
jgi:hypothetical protein